MSLRVPAVWQRLASASPAAKVVYWGLRSLSASPCSASYQELSRAFGISRKSVIHAVNDLQERGLLTIESTTMLDGGSGPNRYVWHR